MKFLLFLLLFIPQISFGQAVPVVLKGKIALDAEKYVGTDAYGSVYFIKNNILYKTEGDKTYQFTDLQLGQLSSVDIINPLKLTLFYRSMNTVVFLDRHLIEINRIRFNQLPVLRTLGFAGTASNNNLWIMNEGTQSLEIYNYLKHEVVAGSQPVSSAIVAHDSNFNFCWLLLPDTLECYNSYGTLVTRVPGITFSAIAESNGNLIGMTEQGLVFIRKNSTTFEPLDLPNMEIQQFFLNDDMLYIYDGEYIFAYQLNLTN